VVSMDQRMTVQLAWTSGEWLAFQRRTRERNARSL